ncbi:MAG: YheT family hydrolase [Adhaeribacter sp.]
MPVLNSAYRGGPFYFFNRHVETIIPALFRKEKSILYHRERIVTPDHDFLDLDWAIKGHRRLTIISHGLEGSTDRPYVKGMAKQMHKIQMDVLAWNFRSCSGEPNKLLRSYHMGATDDLHTVVEYALNTGHYDEIYLVGFSMGGNITLNYLGQQPELVPQQVKAAATFSVPCHILTASAQMAKLENRVYMQRFLKTLHRKLTDKMALLPEGITLDGYEKLKTFPQFDDRFTAPIHGFKNAEDYYTQCSSRQYLPAIRIPTLLVNALNDPFLSPECFPVAEAEQNLNLFLETPRFGGHVGFTEDFWKNIYYSDRRTAEFFSSFIEK